MEQTPFCLSRIAVYTVFSNLIILQVSKLHMKLKPHLLRRMKRDVLGGLPPKREQIVRVELSPLQKDIYRQVLTQNFTTLAANSEPFQLALYSSLLLSWLAESRSIYLSVLCIYLFVYLSIICLIYLSIYASTSHRWTHSMSENQRTKTKQY